MAQSYTLARVKSFIDRIRQEKEGAERSQKRVKEPSNQEYFQGKADMAEDLRRIAESMFDIEREGKE